MKDQNMASTPQELADRAEKAMKEIDAVLQEAKDKDVQAQLDREQRRAFRRVYRAYYAWHHRAAALIDDEVPDEIVTLGGST